MSCLMPMFHFKRIITASNYTVTMIPNHYMLVADPEHPGQWAHRRAVEARYISALDGVWILSAEGKDVISTRILKVTDVYEEGIFAPLTLTGTIVSDDVVASVSAACSVRNGTCMSSVPGVVSYGLCFLSYSNTSIPLVGIHPSQWVSVISQE